MKESADLPLLDESKIPAEISRIVAATRAECGQLLYTEGDLGASIAPEAAETILGLIGLWNIPVLGGAGFDAERTWIWSDLHLRDTGSVWGHGRPFLCRTTHDLAIGRRWRGTVGPTDLVIHAGDFAPEHVGDRRRRTLLDTLPGRKINILGNHDVAALHTPLISGWDATFGALVIASTPPLVMTHCPLRNVPAGAVNVHGHMHRRQDRRNDPRINVAVEQTCYRPVQASAIIAEAAHRLDGSSPRPLDTPR